MTRAPDANAISRHPVAAAAPAPDPAAMARWPWLLLALLLPLPGCADEGGEEGGAEPLRRDSAGVEIVEDLGPDRPLEWRVERLFALGGAETGPASFYELSSGSVAAGGSGRLYVLDSGNYRVAVFDSAGAHIRSMGRQGGGPGELERPWELSVGPGDTAWVYDLAKRGFARRDGRGPGGGLPGVGRAREEVRRDRVTGRGREAP